MAGNFGKLGGFGGMMKAMQSAMKSAQAAEEELAAERISASAGGGMVKVTVTGTGDLLEIKIAREVVDPSDVQMLEDLVSTAVREALENAKELRSEKMSGMLPPGLSIPGM